METPSSISNAVVVSLNVETLTPSTSRVNVLVAFGKQVIPKAGAAQEKLTVVFSVLKKDIVSF